MIYPKIMEAIEEVKSLGMSCFVTTNMTPVTAKRADRMFNLGLDRLYVSLWAATPATYDVTHPNASEKDFHKIDERLRQFRDLKARTRQSNPAIIIHNVIFKDNYHEVRAMIDYALEMGVDAVQFTVSAIIEGSTNVLLMDQRMRDAIIDQLDSIPDEIQQRPGIHGPGTFLWEIDNFRRRVEEDTYSEGVYDGSIFDTLPCQIGWFYTIVEASGQVIPCCKGCTRPMGNIHQTSFREIWYGAKYDEFRNKGKYLPKTDEYFESIGCMKMCDNVGHLRTIEEKMERLRPLEKIAKAANPLVKRFRS